MNLAALFEQARALPVVPKVLRELLNSFNNSALRTDELAQLITSDPAICMRLLRLANSARYHTPQGVGSAYEAVQLLGLVNVRSLVISVGLMSCFTNLPAQMLQPFWQHSLRTAALARHWSAHAEVDGELAYTLGLLHCVGQLVMRQGLASQMLALDAKTDPAAPTRTAVERAALGYSYAEVGAELARRWQFPTLFSEVIGATDALPDNAQAATLAALIQLCAWQAWVTEQPLNSEQVDALWPHELAQRVGVASQHGGSHFGDWAELCDDLQDLLTQS